MKRFFLILAYLISYFGISQNFTVDSLSKRAKLFLGSALDTALNYNDEFYKASLEIDTSDYYLVESIDNYAIIYSRKGELVEAANKAKTLLNENRDRIGKEGESKIYNRIGICFVQKGDFDSTISYFKKALKIREELKDSVGIAASLNNIGMVSSEKGDYSTCIFYLNKALRMREMINDSTGIASTSNNIGLIFYHQKRFKEAIPYYKKALALGQGFGNKNRECLILTNLGNLFDELVSYDSSLFYYGKAVKIAEELNDKRLKAITYGNIGFTHFRLNNLDIADSIYKITLGYRIEMEDLHGLATIYNQIGGLEMVKGNFSLATDAFKNSIENAEKVDAKVILRDSYLGLSDGYESLKNSEMALKYLKLHLAMKDSVFNVETNEKIEEINTKYETEKKEKKIIEQKADIALKEAKVQKRNTQLFALCGGALALLLIGAIIYTKQKAKAEKLQQQIALEKAESVNKVQNEKLRISRDLHDNIGSQLTFVISSLDNMHYIKDDEKRKDKLTQLGSFTKDTMNQLRETIWAIKSESITVEQLVAKVAEFIDKAKVACPQINFPIEGTGDDFELNSNQAINSYRVIQEAINNAIKYSEAESIKFIIEKRKLSIVDNGKGFDLQTTKASNGLINMKARMEEVGFSTEIKSNVGKGTTISISLA